MLKRFIVPAAAIAVLVSTPMFAPAFAQPAPAPDAGYQSGPQHEVPGGTNRRADLQRRVQRWHDRLGITAAQQPQWDAVVAALRENAVAMRNNPAVRAARSDNVNAVDKLQAVASVAQARAEALQRMIPPVQALYAALSPQQQHTADQALDRMMHRREAHRRG